MANNLLKNETNVHYSVRVNDGVVVSGFDFYGGAVRRVQVSRELEMAYQFMHKDKASKVAAFIDGKLIKHTRTEVVTEITEELKLEEEN